MSADYSVYFARIKDQQDLYKDRIDIKAGMEFGIQTHTILRYEALISEILRIVIEDGKRIELNTSYRRYGLKDTMPSVNILKRYRELEGDIITIGSDCHNSGQLE